MQSQQDVELLTELMQSLTHDVAEVKKLLANQPPPPTPPDLRPMLEKVAAAINGVQGQVETLNHTKPSPAKIDLSGIENQLRYVQQLVQQSPARRISQAVQWGAGLLVISLLLAGIVSYWAAKWRDERDRFAESDWKWRGVRQMYPEVHRKLSEIYGDSAGYFQARTVELEQAQEARQNAAAWSQKAEELEGKKRGGK